MSQMESISTCLTWASVQVQCSNNFNNMHSLKELILRQEQIKKAPSFELQGKKPTLVCFYEL